MEHDPLRKPRVRFRTFETLLPRPVLRKRARGEAAEFAQKVGPENVISVCECCSTFGPFTVTVWYREVEVSTGSAEADALLRLIQP